jgi:hypothetical protein
MKVQMKVQISGTRNGEDWPAPGEAAEVSDEEAVSLLNSGLAEAVEAPEPQKATARKAEKR